MGQQREPTRASLRREVFARMDLRTFFCSVNDKKPGKHVCHDNSSENPQEECAFHVEMMKNIGIF